MWCFQLCSSFSILLWLFGVFCSVIWMLGFLKNFLLKNAIRFFFKFNLFIYSYLFLAVLGPRFCARAFSSRGKWEPLFIAVRGPLTIAASPVVEHKLQTRRLSSCGSRAQLLRGTWDPPRPGLKPVSPTLTGRFSTTVPPGKPAIRFLMGITLSL